MTIQSLLLIMAFSLVALGISVWLTKAAIEDHRAWNSMSNFIIGGTISAIVSIVVFAFSLHYLLKLL